MYRAALVLVFVVCSCSYQSFTINSAVLDPLYVYDPSLKEMTLFLALHISLESGSTDLRMIRIEHSTRKIFWEVNFGEDNFFRTPEPKGQTYTLPEFATEDTGSAVDFFYPWFISPGENKTPDGMYSLTVWDYSGQSSRINVRYENLSDEDLRALEGNLDLLSPSTVSENGSYELIYLTKDDLVTRNEVDTSLRSINNENTANTADNIFIWGVPLECDCLVLAGPY